MMMMKKESKLVSTSTTKAGAPAASVAAVVPAADALQPSSDMIGRISVDVLLVFNYNILFLQYIKCLS
jgi:hypothetical protein